MASIMLLSCASVLTLATVIVFFGQDTILVSSVSWSKLLFSACVLALVGFLSYRQLKKVSVMKPDPDAWWGLGDCRSAISTAVRPFQIDIGKDAIDDLKARLARTRFFEPLDGACFRYGFNQHYLRDVITYWKNEYDWFKWQAKLNSLPQYVTSIQGLDVHFVHIKAEGTADRPRAAIMLIHGWPGSFVEFYKAAPMLQAAAAADAGLLLDIVVPSIPGYGFSAAPGKQGFNVTECAHVFGVVMERLGYKKYFVQGGDWGAVIGHTMALQRPDQVCGFHTNFVFPPTANGHLVALPLMVLRFFAPSLIMSSEEHRFNQRRLRGLTTYKELSEELGYFNLQSTKPDTIGAALADSPAGLAAYILEKFSTWTNATNRDKKDGAVTEAFTLDELLTNVMVYWLSGNVASSMRFYKEYSKISPLNPSVPLTVPTGITNFPGEIVFFPRIIAGLTRPNIVHYTLQENGGHFPAFQLPSVYCTDVLHFIRTVRQMPPVRQ